MSHTDSVVVELDKPRRMRFTIAAQIELERSMGGLGMLEIATKITTTSITAIKTALWIGLKTEDARVGTQSNMDSILERARLREIEVNGKRERISNAYIARQLLEAFRVAGVFGDPGEELTPEDDVPADPTPAASPSM